VSCSLSVLHDEELRDLYSSASGKHFENSMRWACLKWDKWELYTEFCTGCFDFFGSIIRDEDVYLLNSNAVYSFENELTNNATSTFRIKEQAKVWTSGKQVVSSSIRDGGERSQPVFLSKDLFSNSHHRHCDPLLSSLFGCTCLQVTYHSFDIPGIKFQAQLLDRDWLGSMEFFCLVFGICSFCFHLTRIAAPNQ
jgi:hypothetical protein